MKLTSSCKSPNIYANFAICFKVCMSKISDKTDKSNLCWSPLIMQTQCISITYSCVKIITLKTVIKQFLDYERRQLCL